MRLLTLATAIFVNGLHVQANIGPPGVTSSMPPPPALSSPTILSDNPEVVPTMPAPPSNTTELAIVTQFENLRVNAKTLLRFDPESSTNMLSGAVVALAMIPEAVGFSFVAGISPIMGLWTTVVLGFMAACFGGRPGIMSGASGAVAVVVAPLVATHGVQYLAPCAILAGIIQCAAGYFKVGKWIRLVPHPVMLGFVNGLAIVMTKSQLSHFSGLDNKAAKATMIGLTALTMIAMKVIPLVTKAVPASLLTILITTLVSKVFSLPAKTLMDVAGAETFKGGFSVLPKLALPKIPFTLKSLKVILPFAFTMATVGLIESLLTLQLVDGLVDDGKRGSTSKECRGQGIGNIFSGVIGGMGGCALIGQSLINVEAGGTGKLAGITMSATLGLGLLAFAPLLGQIPLASLVGIMLLVCQQTFAWSSLRLFGKIPKLDALIIVLVSYITVVEDLAIAVVSGTILSALSFAWKQSTQVHSTQLVDSSGFRVFQLFGPIFFGSTQRFESQFDVKNIPESEVVIDFGGSRVYDHSALETITTVADKLRENGKKVHLRRLSPDCQLLLGNMHEGGTPPFQIERDEQRDPRYSPVSDAYAK
ncbi:hypothetical protein TrVE_jg13895 [Triparma verrucosa]|uniref:STAS domain-containing protein n=1 Tax=Triparma verrucosa TaxID=1606542 RepID=A0A9W7BQL8_9STRA|nr:hypothetical protein TrVE_jg13895 [Triparma verrucosa]